MMGIGKFNAMEKAVDTEPESIKETINPRPEYVDRAFDAYYYGAQGQYEEDIEEFIRRWGGLDIEAFRSALEYGTSEEKLIALFAISYSHTPQARDILLPFLASANPMERWVSALGLGDMRDERALPMLIQMLDEFLPPEIKTLSREGGLYNAWRIRIAVLLSDWGRSDLIPFLRRALQKSWDIEQAEEPDLKHEWHDYQDILVYLLGQHGAFGVLTGPSVSISRLKMWTVILACGSFQARVHYGDPLAQLALDSPLRKEVMRVLEQRFALTEEEQRHYLDHYFVEYLARM